MSGKGILTWPSATVVQLRWSSPGLEWPPGSVDTAGGVRVALPQARHASPVSRGGDVALASSAELPPDCRPRLHISGDAKGLSLEALRPQRSHRSAKGSPSGSRLAGSEQQHRGSITEDPAVYLLGFHLNVRGFPHPQ